MVIPLVIQVEHGKVELDLYDSKTKSYMYTSLNFKVSVLRDNRKMEN